MKLTKNSLRSEQSKLSQLEKYLPTLQLKKSMLQVEVNQAKAQIKELIKALDKAKVSVDGFAPLLSEENPVTNYAEVKHVDKVYENIAGVEIPKFEKVIFQEADYLLFDTPAWTDSAIILLRKMVSIREQRNIASEKQRALEKELRDVTIRVNLFEKVLIPRCRIHIKKIKIFLGDQELSAVSQAKVAKMKIEKKKVYDN